MKLISENLSRLRYVVVTLAIGGAVATAGCDTQAPDADALVPTGASTSHETRVEAWAATSSTTGADMSVGAPSPSTQVFSAAKPRYRSWTRSTTPPSPSPSPTLAAVSPTTVNGWPDATNTGVPSSTQLTNYTGPMTIETPGTVIDGKIFTQQQGKLTISAANVVIKNSLFRNNDTWAVSMDDRDPTSSLLIQDSEFAGPDSEGTDAAIRGRGWSLLRVNIHGYTDGAKMDGGNSLVDCFLHDFKIFSSSAHADGLQGLGGIANVAIRHNTILLDLGQGAAGVIQLGTEYGGNSNIAVDNNYLRGPYVTIFYSGLYRPDGVTMFAPDSDGRPTTSDGIKFTNNTVVPTDKSIASYNAWITNHGFEWFGNVQAGTGQVIPPPQSATL